MRRFIHNAVRSGARDAPNVPVIIGDGRPADGFATEHRIKMLGLDLDQFGKPITCGDVLYQTPNLLRALVTSTLQLANGTLFVFPNHLYVSVRSVFKFDHIYRLPPDDGGKVFARRDIAAITILKDGHNFEIVLKPKSEITVSTASGRWRSQSLAMARFLPEWFAA